MSNARNIAALSTVEVGATADQTKADLNAIGVSGGRKNLIINGGMDVWQRGTSFASPSVHTADRWLSYAASATVSKAAVTDLLGFSQCMKVTSGSADPYFVQKIEGTYFRGQTLTFSFWVNGGVPPHTMHYDYTNTYSAATPVLIETVGSWKRYATVYTVPATTPTQDYLTLRIDLAENSSSNQYLTGVQVELGSVATDFEHRSYGEELALCQRYCIVRGAVNAVYTGASTGISQYFVDLPQTMKSTPTVIVYGVGGYPSSANNYDKDGVGNVSVNVAPKRYGFTVYNLSGSGQFGYKAEAEL